MTDTNNSEDLTVEKQNFYKNIEFYSAGVAAWYNSSLEHDKSLLTLSAGGIGLLITLLTTVGLESYYSLILYVLALICFVACLISVLLIFKGNKNHIVKLFNEEEFENPYLDRVDKIAMCSFILGVIFAAIIGVTTAYQQFSKEKSMSDNKSKTNPIIANDSFSGAQLMKKSFTGVSQLKPTAASSSSGNQAGSNGASQQATANSTQQATTNSTAKSTSSDK